MRYKIVHQFRWLIILLLTTIIYISNFILIKLPFVSISFPPPYYFVPSPHFEFQIYNIQTVLIWAIGIVFGSITSLITACFYLLIGLLGFPMFASGGGFDYYKEPTFGYLISLPVLAFLSGWLHEQNEKFLAVFIPIFTTHLFGILYLILFQQNRLDLTWHLSFSMISYDLIFALLLTPIIPVISFVLNEIFIQEVPVRDSLFATNRSNLDLRYKQQTTSNDYETHR